MPARTTHSPGPFDAVSELEPDALSRVFAVLSDRAKIDFTSYKQSMVNPRIERRMRVNQIREIGDYARYLEEYPGEVDALCRDLLIGVTSFFRDHDAFEALGGKWLPDLLRRVVTRPLRFWVAGCSSGEEAYSLAMVCREVMERLTPRADVKVFATDVDRDAIRFAGEGVYPVSIADKLPRGFSAKYFTPRSEGLQIVRPIREMVIFARHDLVRDPPLTHMDLVSCRNLLIYMQPVLQRRALESFRLSLYPEGMLFLGSCEATGELADYFDCLDYGSRIYRRNR